MSPFGKTNKASQSGAFSDGGSMSNIKWYLVRRWLYGVVSAGVPVAIYLGWLDVEAAPLILPLVLAAFNTTPPPVPGESE